MGGRESPGVVIVGGQFHSLGAARNLARHGISVHVLDAGLCVAQFSWHVRRFFKCPEGSGESG